MSNPIAPFPKFSPIGGLPWPITALLLPHGKAAIMTFDDPEPPPVKKPELTVVRNSPPDNVVSLFAKKPSGNDNDNDLTLA